MDSRKLMLAQQSPRYYEDMNIGQRLFSARRRAGLSQQQVADYLGKNKAAVSLWETSVNTPTVNDRVDLSKLLDIPFSDLLPEAQTPVETTDPVLLQVIERWPAIAPRLRPAVLMLVAKLAEVAEPSAARPAPQLRRLPRSTAAS
jgi:transcriptional regulator with XRE-family HTH domain